MYVVLIACILIAVPVFGQRQGDEEGFQRKVCSLLGQKLRTGGPIYSRDLLEELARQEGGDGAEVRARLREMLDRLAAQREERTRTWKALVSLGGDEIGERKVDKFFRELERAARKILKERGNYGLARMVEQAAGKAGLLPFQGKELLLKALEMGKGKEVSRLEALPEKIGLLVEGESQYPVDAERFYGLLVNETERLELEKVKDVHRPIVEALVRELPKSERIRWAIDRPRPHLHPECRLSFWIEEFYTKEGLTPAGRSAFVPAVEMIAQVVLKRLPSGSRLYSDRMTFTYDFSLERDDRIQSLRLLDRFYEKVAREIRQALDQFLAGQ